MTMLLAVPVALTLSNFHIASRVEFLHSVSRTVQILYLAIERTALAAVTFIRHLKHKRSLIVQERLAGNYDMPLRNFKNQFGVICAWVNETDSLFYFGTRKN